MKVAIALIIVIPMALIAYFALSAPGVIKDYRFPRVEIDATVRPDGALVLNEKRTFAFEGDFSFAYFTVDWPPDLLQDFSISENGQPYPIAPLAEGGGTRVDWTFDAQDESRTFDIRYVALCAVDVYQDTAHLLWQFVGRTWEKETDFLRVRIHLPPAARKTPRPGGACPQPSGEIKETRPLGEGEIRAWGHGPLAGEVRIPDSQTVELIVRDLKPTAFVEGSIVFPNQSVPFAPLETGESLESILAEERRLVEETNDLRLRHDRETAFTWVLFFLFPAFLITMLILARRRDRVPDVPRHLEEPPEDIHPVELAVLWSTSRGSLNPKTAYRAQLLHLVQQGTIEVTPVGLVSDPDDFQLRLKKPPGELDTEFVSFLFAENGQGPILMKEIKAKGSRRDRLTSWWKRVGGRTKRKVEAVVRGRTRVESTAALLGALAVGTYGYWRSVGFDDGGGMLFDGLVGPLAAWLIPLAVIGFIITKRLMPSRLPANLRERLAKWTAFRRYLTEFQTFEDAPAAAIIIWEKYLVYATALGVADEVEKQVRALVPAERLPEPWPGAPTGEDGYRFYHHSIGSSPSHVASNAATAVGWSSGWGSGSSGGGGGGGGFSGGGGGGGGGTGGGAG